MYTVIVSDDTIVDAALEFAKSNCPSYITNDGIIDPLTSKPVYKFYFSDEKDTLIFMLGWG